MPDNIGSWTKHNVTQIASRLTKEWNLLLSIHYLTEKIFWKKIINLLTTVLAIKSQYLKNYCPPSKIRNYKTKLEILMSNNFFLKKIFQIFKNLCQNSLMKSKIENIQPQASMLYYWTKLWKQLKSWKYLAFNTLNDIFTTQTQSSNIAQPKTNLKSLATYCSTIW